MRFRLLIGVVLGFALLAWTESHARPTAYVVNYPLQYLTERIGAEHVKVVLSAPAGEDPVFWKPDINTIVELLPKHKNAFEQRYSGLEQDLLALDQRLDEIATHKRAQPLLASHPVYQYLAGRYGLNLQSVLWEPEVMPDAGQWQTLR